MKKNALLLLLFTAVLFLNSCTKEEREELKEDINAISLSNQTFRTTKVANNDVIYDSEGELKAHNLYEEWKFQPNRYIEDKITDNNIGTYTQEYSEGSVTMTDGEFLGTHILNIGKDNFVFGFSKNGEHYNVTFQKK